MPTNKYDKQQSFIRTKADYQRGIRNHIKPPRSDRNRHEFTGICRNSLEN